MSPVRRKHASSRAGSEQSELTVVIPSWNRVALLRNCLLSLDRQTIPVRILVVDNGSEDGTGEMLRQDFPEVIHLRQERNLGFVRAVNLGIQAVETPYLALLNNDTEVDPEWAEAGLTAFADYPEHDLFASQMLQFDFRDRLDSAGDCYDRFGMPSKRGYGEPANLFQRAEAVPAASAGAAFYRRELFEDVGHFDEDFYLYLEDVEFSLRCQLLGHRCLYLPLARVYHLEAASDSERTRKARKQASQPFYSSSRVFWITRNRFHLMLLYQPLKHLPFLCFGWAKSFGFHLLKAGFLGAFLRGLGAGILMAPRTLRKRRHLRRRQRISKGELCRLLRQC